MTDTMYDTLKAVLSEQERLFAKLLKVAREYDAIDFDESGLYQEEAERCERHWNTLAGKIASALDTALADAEVKLLKNREPNVTHLKFDIIVPADETEETPELTTRVTVDYATGGQLAITR